MQTPPPPPPPPRTPARGKLQLRIAPNAATNDAATQSFDPNPPSGNYRVRWRGKITDEMPISLILRKTENGELGMLTQIEVNARWLTIRDFLAGHEQSEKERIATANREAEVERARRKEEAVRDAAEKKRLADENAAELARQHELEIERARAPIAAQQGTAFCRFCGNQILVTAAMCMKCGSPIGNHNSAATRKSRTVYVLLALFFGPLGIHNFYAEYYGRGAAQLLICIFFGWLILPILILWIWNLFEIFAVKQDPNGNPFN